MFTQMESIDGKAVFTVQQLNQAARSRLEEVFQLVWVKGELSNVSMPRSGHIYFTLKDQSAQVRCAMFKGSNRHLNFTPKDGLEVLVRAQVSIYEERGDYQLIITQMEESGVGTLQKAFEALKNKLQAQGLFDPLHKKPFPPYPKHIGIVTSHTGAAIQDILSVLKRRYPIANVSIFHTQVQGKGAEKEIVRAIESANQHQGIDVIIIARGGGSLEDLWCFNEESVAKAIYASRLPTITGIGHEIDFTIADFVADRRAPTPSAAAETITPDTQELIQVFEHKKQRLINAMQRRLSFSAQHLDNLEKRLVHPGMIIQQAFQLGEQLQKRLYQAIQNRLEKANFQLSVLSAKLHAVSPLATLSRGYAIVSTQEGKVIQSTAQLSLNQQIKTQLGTGTFESIVNKLN